MWCGSWTGQLESQRYWPNVYLYFKQFSEINHGPSNAQNSPHFGCIPLKGFFCRVKNVFFCNLGAQCSTPDQCICLDPLPSERWPWVQTTAETAFSNLPDKMLNVSVFQTDDHLRVWWRFAALQWRRQEKYARASSVENNLPTLTTNWCHEATKSVSTILCGIKTHSTKQTRLANSVIAIVRLVD